MLIIISLEMEGGGRGFRRNGVGRRRGGGWAEVKEGLSTTSFRD